MRSRILALLDEDHEFRLSVAGLVGLKEVLERLEEHDKKFNELLARQDEHDRKFEEILGRLEEHDRKFEEILGRLEEHDRKFEEILSTLKEHSRSFKALDLKIEALGLRWGIFAEQAFRESMRNVIEQYFGGEVGSWIHDDKEGIVFGHPSKVEVDLVVKGEEHILIEVKSSIHRSDVSQLLREGRLYEKVKGVKPKLAIISPFVEEDAKEEAKSLGIPVFTRTSV